jgi:hypothetical protein
MDVSHNHHWRIELQYVGLYNGAHVSFILNSMYG